MCRSIGTDLPFTSCARGRPRMKAWLRIDIYLSFALLLSRSLALTLWHTYIHVHVYTESDAYTNRTQIRSVARRLCRIICSTEERRERKPHHDSRLHRPRNQQERLCAYRSGHVRAIKSFRGNAAVTDCKQQHEYIGL